MEGTHQPATDQADGYSRHGGLMISRWFAKIGLTIGDVISILIALLVLIYFLDFNEIDFVDQSKRLLLVGAILFVLFAAMMLYLRRLDTSNSDGSPSLNRTHLSPKNLPIQETNWYKFIREAVSEKCDVSSITKALSGDSKTHAERLQTVLKALTEKDKFIYVDWNTEFEEILSYFNDHLALTGLKPIPQNKMESLEKQFDGISIDDTGYQRKVFGFLEKYVKAKNKTILIIDVSSDGFYFKVVDPLIFDRWHNVLLEGFAWIIGFQDQSKKSELSRTLRFNPKQISNKSAVRDTRSILGEA